MNGYLNWFRILDFSLKLEGLGPWAQAYLKVRPLYLYICLDNSAKP